MDAAPRYRTMVVRENCDEDGVVSVPEPEPYVDAMVDAVRLEDTELHPNWHCYSESCGGQLNPGERMNCVYCGQAREDV